MRILGRDSCKAYSSADLLPAIALLYALFLLPWEVGAQQESDFFTVTPCRVYDSRWGAGPLTGGFDRWIPVGGYCGVPPDASAAAFNLTAVTPSGNGLLSVYPCCPYVQDIVQGLQEDRTLAGLALVRLGEGGKVEALLDAPFSTTADLVADVSGYFRPTAPVQQWREWEETLLSPADYTLNGGDPYSEVELDIRFTDMAAGLSFVQPAYWDGDELSPRIFKVSTALPAGNWTWKIESCTRNSVSCLSGWAPNQGSFAVQSNTSSGNPLYDRGFVEQVETVVGGQVVALSEPVFPDGTKFDWLGDTAWAAPPREISGQTKAWALYIADRKSKGFTVIQIAPAVAWQLNSPLEALPPAGSTAFKLKKSCPDKDKPSPIPNTDCWQVNGKYWRRFKEMIQQATKAGLLVAVVGVMNPVGIDPDATYPDATGAKKFARDLVGRLGSAAVMYSPAFDDDPDANNGNRRLLMDEVGKLLLDIIPKPLGPGKRRALSNHLASGKSNCDEYQAFAGWMTHYLFQSGHGAANDTTGPCAPRDSYTDVQNALMRARVMPMTLSSYTAPRKLPAINAEGPYDTLKFSGNVKHPNVDTRYRIRQAAYSSSLSNAIGFSYGAYGLTFWDDTNPNNDSLTEPATYFNLDAAQDMTRLKSNLQGPGLLVSHPDWILNNAVDEKYKMVLASNEASFVMAYLPGDEGTAGGSSDRITIDATKLPCQVCPSKDVGSPWTFTWVNPINNAITRVATCSPAAGQLSFQRPTCGSDGNQDCDWLLKLERTGACPSVQFEAAASNSLGAWSDTSAGDGTSAIFAAQRGPGEEGDAILLSPAGRAFQTAPRVSRIKGYDLIVWQADGLDGSLSGIYGSLISPQGEALGPFKINHYTEHDQREPAVAGRMRGEALVVWSSYGQDGDRGGIFGRLVKPRIQNDDLPQDNLGEELEIAEIREGHQQHPQILADTGGYWVAWETVDRNGLSRGVSVRRLGLDGRPVAAEIQLPAAAGEQSKLLALDSPTPDSVAVHWWRQEARGSILERLQQRIGPHGPLGPVTPGRN